MFEVGVAVGFCKVDVKPSEPTHDHIVALVELADNVTVPPLHIGPLLVAPEEVGKGFTVTVVVKTVEFEHPELLIETE